MVFVFIISSFYIQDTTSVIATGPASRGLRWSGWLGRLWRLGWWLVDQINVMGSIEARGVIHYPQSKVRAWPYTNGQPTIPLNQKRAEVCFKLASNKIQFPTCVLFRWKTIQICQDCQLNPVKLELALFFSRNRVELMVRKQDNCFAFGAP